MKNLTKCLMMLLLVGAALLLAYSPVLASEEAEGDFFEIRAIDLKWVHDGMDLTNGLVVLPVGIEILYRNVDPLITDSGLEGITPHGVKILDQSGTLRAQSPVLFGDVKTFRHKFTAPGVYNLQCLVHPFMKTQLHVFDLGLPKTTLVSEDLGQK